ncbi:redoxin domain-containing protein [Flavobacteriaceae bacterium R38]|nr:redoxin domain-containing protein [Flavobacteriaceae bacterium R38]
MKFIKLIFPLFLIFILTSCNSQGGREYKKINQKKAVLKVNRKNIEKGKQSPSFTLPGLSGEMISLEDYKGKYVLLDFWASWCPTCRKHNKALVPVYEKLKNNNFEIIGVSLDRKKEHWEKAIKKYNYNWPQVSDLKGIDSEIPTAYGIQYVPNFVLIAPDGNIVKKYSEKSIKNLEQDLKTLLLK